MGVRDWVNRLLGGGAVGSFAPDEESGKDGDDAGRAIAVDCGVRSDIEAEKARAFDRLSDTNESGGRGDYGPLIPRGPGDSQRARRDGG